MQNLVCLNSNTYHGFSLDEALNGTANAGFRNIELAAVRGYTEHVRWEMTDAEIEEVLSKLKTLQLDCIALGAHSNLMRDEGVDNFGRSIELAHRLGCSYIVTSTGEAHDDHDEIEDEQVLIHSIHKLIEQCAKYDVTMVIETHGNNYATGQAVKALVQQVNSPYLAINYDTANTIFYGNTMPYEDLEQSSDHVKFIHLKDKLGDNQEWNFPAIGQGDLDFKRIFDILNTHECIAPLSVEIEFTSAGPANLAEVDLAVAESYKAIRHIQAQM